MSSECNFCTNKTQCAECDKGWLDKFIPSKEVASYFHRCYVGVRGINGSAYSFNTTNKDLIPTHHVVIDSRFYCPYCGEEMFPIQDSVTLAITGHCCICQGARDEIEYENKKKELEKKYEEESRSLQNEYRDKLSFCAEKLLEIKQEAERKHFEFFSPKNSHFTGSNKIEDLIR